MSRWNYLCAFVLFGLLGISPSASARDENAREILAKLEKKYESVRDASVTFTQHVVFGVTKAEQSFSGKLLMKRGNKYRVELEQQTIVTDGKSVWSYNKINDQIIIDRFRDDPQSISPDKILVNVPENYTATIIGKERVKGKETTLLKLVPKAKKSGVRSMKVWVDRDAWMMRQVQVLDVSENLTTYSVDEIKLNQGIADSQFQFEPPKGAEIVDLR